MVIKKFTLGEYQSNCYIISHNSLATVIDPGYPSDKVVSYLTEKNLDLQFIFLTHGHFDHIGGVNYLKKHFHNAKVLIHMNDTIWLEKNKYNLTGEKVIFDQIISVEHDLMLDDLILKIIFTPGHSLGGMSLLVDNHLFVGDTLFKMSIGRTDLLDGDFNTLVTSIKKLYQLPDKIIVYPGHGETTTIGFEKKYNYYVRN